LDTTPQSTQQHWRHIVLRPPVLVALSVGLVALVRIVWFVDLPLIEQVIRIPDDAFYYLVLARNFAESGSWTFDHMSTTSGFHPLHAFYLALVSAISGAAEFSTMLWASGLAAVVAMSRAAYLCAQIVSRSGWADIRAVCSRGGAYSAAGFDADEHRNGIAVGHLGGCVVLLERAPQE